MTSMIGTSWRLALLTVLLAACSSPTTVSPVVHRAPVTVMAPPTPDAGLLAAPGGVAPGIGDCGPCCDKNPAAQAGATQGISFANPTNHYVGKDTYTNVVVIEGTVLYSLTPGAAPGFAVAEHTLREAGGSWANYYNLVQVTTDPGKDAEGMPRKLRDKVRAFYVIGPICVARGTAKANPQFGSGGGTQYYVASSDVDKLRPGESTPISQWDSFKH